MKYRGSLGSTFQGCIQQPGGSFWLLRPGRILWNMGCQHNSNETSLAKGVQRLLRPSSAVAAAAADRLFRLDHVQLFDWIFPIAFSIEHECIV